MCLGVLVFLLLDNIFKEIICDLGVFWFDYGCFMFWVDCGVLLFNVVLIVECG